MQKEPNITFVFISPNLLCFSNKAYSDGFFDRFKSWPKIEPMYDIQKIVVLQLAVSDVSVFSSTHRSNKIA